MTKVTTIVLNGFTNDSRVLKENVSLKKAGYDVKILALHKKGLPEYEIIEEISVHRMNASKRNLVKEDTNIDVTSIIEGGDENSEVTNIKNEIENEVLLNQDEKALEDTIAKSSGQVLDVDNDMSLGIVSKTEVSIESSIANTKHEEYRKLSLIEKLVSWLRKLRRMMIRQVKLFVGWLRKLRRMMIRQVKLFVGWLRKLRRMTIRQVKLFVGWLRKGKRRVINLKNKFLNKYFKLHRLKFNLLFAKAAKDSDIIHCNDLLTLPMGVIVKKFYNKDVKIVYDAHEYETELNGLEGGKKKFRKFLEKSLIKYADKVITVSDAIANEYVRLYNIEKPALVLNTPPYTKIEKKNIFRETFGIDEDKTIFLYQGGLVNGRGIEDILESFKEISNDKSVIVFMGYGVFEDTIKKAAQTYDNIFFHPAVSPDVLLNYTSSADFGISMIEDICLSYRYCLPNKMFEYIMAEVPVIVSNLPEMKKVVEKYNVGVVAKNSGKDGLEEAILRATQLDKKELNKNIQKAKEVFNWEEQERVLLAIYSELSQQKNA